IAFFKKTNRAEFVQQLSVAVGGTKVQVVPHWNVKLLAQAMTGGTLSTIVTVCAHVTALPQQSEIVQVRVTTTGHKFAALVTVLLTIIVGGLVQQASTAIGVSNTSAVPQLIVLLVGQVTTGGCVSTMFSTWIQAAETFVQQSVATQVSV